MPINPYEPPQEVNEPPAFGDNSPTDLERRVAALERQVSQSWFLRPRFLTRVIRTALTGDQGGFARLPAGEQRLSGIQRQPAFLLTAGVTLAAMFLEQRRDVVAEIDFLARRDKRHHEAENA